MYKKSNHKKLKDTYKEKLSIEILNNYFEVKDFVSKSLDTLSPITKQHFKSGQPIEELSMSFKWYHDIHKHEKQQEKKIEKLSTQNDNIIAKTLQDFIQNSMFKNANDYISLSKAAKMTPFFLQYLKNSSNRHENAEYYNNEELEKKLEKVVENIQSSQHYPHRTDKKDDLVKSINSYYGFYIKNISLAREAKAESGVLANTKILLSILDKFDLSVRAKNVLFDNEYQSWVSFRSCDDIITEEEIDWINSNNIDVETLGKIENLDQ